jgi:hypothetical protein
MLLALLPLLSSTFFTFLSSWEPVVYPEYWVSPKETYKYNMWLLPLKKDNEPAVVASQIKESVASEE